MKRVETEIEIEATPEEVWEALSTGEGLKRWFPLDARVKPGVGGSVWLSWGEGSDWESPIEVWEPSRHLRTVDTMPQADGAAPLRIAVDYYIESRGGKTVMRLVHSGFADSHWQDELDSMSAGWATFLFTLKHSLEKHEGRPRFVAFFRHPVVKISRSEVFARTLAALGFDHPDALRVGERYAVTTRLQDRLVGETRVVQPPINLTATVENWNDGVLMVEIEPGRDQCRPAVWLSLYGEAGEKGPDVQRRLRELLETEFAAVATQA